MLRFFRSQSPNIGDSVVVCITTIEDDIIYCKLMEYGEINGIICKADVSKKLTKIYNSLTVGKLIPVVCTDVNLIDEKISVDLNYSITESSIIKNIISDYEGILKIINIIKWYVSSNYEENKFYSISYTILENTIYNFSKEEIIDIFYNDVSKLHTIINNWNISENLKNILLTKYPLPKKEISISFNILTTNSFGTDYIIKKINELTEIILKYDTHAEINIVSKSAPEYTLNIKSISLTVLTYNDYKKVIDETLITLKLNN